MPTRVNQIGLGHRHLSTTEKYLGVSPVEMASPNKKIGKPSLEGLALFKMRFPVLSLMEESSDLNGGLFFKNFVYDSES